MIKTFILIFFLLTSVTWADWVPKGFKEWQDSDNMLVHRKRIGGQIANFKQSNGQWARIENGWTRSGQDYHSRNGLLKVDVTREGQSQVELTYNDTIYTVTQQMVELGLIDTTSWDWIGEIMKPNWPSPSVHDDVLRWSNLFPHVVYEIEKDNGVARHRIILGKNFLNNVKVIYSGRFDSLELALANTIRFEFSDNIADTVGLMNERVLKDLGDHIFLLPRQTLHHAGRDSMPELETVVRQRWVWSGDTLFCTEYVMASEVMRIFNLFPDSGMHHNDETKVIDGTTNVEDAGLRSGSNADKNYGGGTSWYVDSDDISRAVIRVKNVSSELGGGATISACVCSCYCYAETGFENATAAYRIFKPWVEGDENGVDDDDGDATWNDWASDTYEWAKAGCDSANDAGADNSSDGDDPDRKATAEDTEGVDATGWYGWDISADLAQDWYDGSVNEEGVVLVAAATNYKYFRSTESAEAEKPFWTFTYMTAGVPETHRRRIMELK